MKLLAIDTSTDACSVALKIGDDVLNDHRIAPQQHAAIVLPMIDQLMSDAGVSATDLDGLVFGRGPGSFTGVRIGVAVAQGIALGADLGVLGISTLQSVAQGCAREFGDTSSHVCIDARMDEVYYCRYLIDEQQRMQCSQQELVCTPEELLATIVEVESLSEARLWSGSGAERYAQVLLREADRVRTDRLPQAQDLLALALPQVACGQLLPAEQAMPVYLRDKVAKTTKERMAEKVLKNSVQ